MTIKPVILPHAAQRPTAAAPAPLSKNTVIESSDSLTLQCGKSSITLYANGKIVLRGDHIFSDAGCTNSIAGGQIELN